MQNNKMWYILVVLGIAALLFIKPVRSRLRRMFGGVGRVGRRLGRRVGGRVGRGYRRLRSRGRQLAGKFRRLRPSRWGRRR